jgi:UDP-N-acetylglucosamine diphosphorylase/glucosamine-1-phosphate N-acetyltransferase
VIDASDGPVALGDGAVVMPNAVIIGPAWIGPKALIKVGAKIYGGSSIGRHSKAGGEIEGSVIMPFTNKAHEGFLGHSYLGSWVNLGADTNTSDLKNTYGPVKAWSDGTLLDTGLQFLGLMMGDHSKSGINVMFDTGTVAGVCCNLYGAGLPPKSIPSFSWGEPGRYATYRVDDCIGTMKRVMARRNVEPDEAYLGLVRSVFNSTAAERDRSR